MGIFSNENWGTTAGLIGSVVGGIFSRGGGTSPAIVSRAPAISPTAKKDDTTIFIIGGAALFMVMIFMFMKK